MNGLKESWGRLDYKIAFIMLILIMVVFVGGLIFVDSMIERSL